VLEDGLAATRQARAELDRAFASLEAGKVLKAVLELRRADQRMAEVERLLREARGQTGEESGP
jgi:hypothetical protein